MIILLFGQPASGKTTLAKELQRVYIDLIHIDGDEWRDVTQNKDYSREGRMRNLKGAFDMALYLERKDFSVVLSFVTPFEELRQYLQNNSQKLHQIYLTYNGDRGRNNYFANEFDEPSDSCLHIDTSSLNISDCINKIMKYVGNETKK